MVSASFAVIVRNAERFALWLAHFFAVDFFLIAVTNVG